MFVRSSIRGNAAAANSRCLSQAKKRYVASTRNQAPVRPVKAASHDRLVFRLDSILILRLAYLDDAAIDQQLGRALRFR
jgi:hypothetical protein